MDKDKLAEEILGILKESAGRFWNENDKEFWTERAKELAELKVEYELATDQKKEKLAREIAHVDAQIKLQYAGAVLDASEEAKNALLLIARTVGRFLLSAVFKVG